MKKLLFIPIILASCVFNTNEVKDELTPIAKNDSGKYCHYYFDCNIDYFQDIGHRLSHKSEKGEFLFFKEKGINNFARFQVVNGDTLQVSPSASIFNQIELKGDTIKGFVNGTIVIYTK